MFAMDMVLKEGSEAVKQRIIDKTYINGQCRLWNGTEQNGYGVINVKVRQNVSFTWKRFYVHKLLYLIEKNKQTIGNNMQLSHLCNNSLCTSIHHLSEENATTNMQRSTCFGQNYCTGHGNFPNCII